MFKKVGFLAIAMTVLMSCYPMGMFQGLHVLPEGEETVGLGLGWMTNVASLVDTSVSGKTAFFADGSVLFRFSFSNNTEMGLKFVGRPRANGSTLIDVLTGKRIILKDDGGTLAPFFGVHQAQIDPENIFYSLGFGFAMPLDYAFKN